MPSASVQDARHKGFDNDGGIGYDAVINFNHRHEDTDMDMIANLLTAYDNASASDANDGAAWYAEAQAFAAALAAGTSLTLSHAAGIVAALSPRTQWGVNMQGASAIVNAALDGLPEPIVGGLGANRSKAWRIANGENPVDVLGGQKVRAFFANIMGDVDAVTIDVWAARAALGEYNNKTIPAGQYAAIADAYRLAADARGVSPMVMQATVWVYIRRTGGR